MQWRVIPFSTVFSYVRRMPFTQKQLDTFATLASDFSPLHTDADYCRSTPHGEPVLHGMAAVLKALGDWAGGKPFVLQTLRGRFMKALHLNREYEIRVEKKSDWDQISLYKGPQLQARFVVQGKFLEAPHPEGIYPPVEAPVTVAKTSILQSLRLEGRRYSLNPKALDDLQASFGLSPGQMPFAQLQAICWSSYFIGMECPGRQALYLGFDFKFSPPSDEVAALSLPEISLEGDTARSFVAIKTDIPQVGAVSLSAFFRPAPITLQPRPKKPIAPALSGKKVLITGASRGLGAELAIAFGQASCEVVISFARSQASAEAVKALVDSAGGKGTLLQGDLCDPHVAQGWDGELDVLVLSASPPIRSEFFLEQSDEEFHQFLQTSLKLITVPLRQFLPRLAPNGIVLFVSSVYVTEQPPQFSHYLTAKAAGEALVQSLAREFPERLFLTARLPKMLTDQTNAITKVSDVRDPREVAEALVEQVASRLGQIGHHAVT